MADALDAADAADPAHAPDAADAADLDRVLDADGLSVAPRHFPWIASLRYFDAGGDFTAGLAALLGGAMPRPLQCAHYAPAAGTGVRLICCHSTETLALCESSATGAALQAYCDGRADGCLVELTGGLWAWTVAGGRGADLIARLGSVAAVPGPGEARTARLAEIAATVVRVAPEELLLLVDRVYAEHLQAWMRETLADFPPGPASARVTVSDARD
jgi:hypothetical protein